MSGGLGRGRGIISSGDQPTQGRQSNNPYSLRRGGIQQQGSRPILGAKRNNTELNKPSEDNDPAATTSARATESENLAIATETPTKKIRAEDVLLSPLQIPVTAITYEATKDIHLERALQIANILLKTDGARSTFKSFLIKSVNAQETWEDAWITCHDRIKNVKLLFKEYVKNTDSDSDYAVSWTERDKTAKEISINKIFELRLNELDKQVRSEDADKEIRVIVVYIGICIFHEMAHLVFRWTGHKFTPPRFKIQANKTEAGHRLEHVIFGGIVNIHFERHNDKYDEKTKYIAISKTGIWKETIEKGEASFFTYGYISSLYQMEFADIPENYTMPPLMQDQKEIDKIPNTALKIAHLETNSRTDYTLENISKLESTSNIL